MLFKTPSHSNIKTAFVQASEFWPWVPLAMLLTPCLFPNCHYFFFQPAYISCCLKFFLARQFLQFFFNRFYLEPYNFDSLNKNCSRIRVIFFLSQTRGGDIGELPANGAVLSPVLSVILSMTYRPVGQYSEMDPRSAVILSPTFETTL